MDKNEKILVSVIVPCYNCENIINDLIQSILLQTMTDFELILINDGSKDNTQAVIDSLEKKYSCVKCIDSGRKGENLGLSMARNAGIRKASGKYLMFADQDDKVSPDWMKTMFDVAERENADLVSCAYREIIEGKAYNFDNPSYMDISGGVYAVRAMMEGKTAGQPWVNLVSRDLVINNHILFEPTVFEDLFFKMRALYYCRRFIQLEDYLYDWYIDSKSTSHNITIDNEKYSYLKGVAVLPGLIQKWIDELNNDSDNISKEDAFSIQMFFANRLLKEFVRRRNQNRIVTNELLDKYLQDAFGGKGIYLKVVLEQYALLYDECQLYKEYRENIRHPYKGLKKWIAKKSAL